MTTAHLRAEAHQMIEETQGVPTTRAAMMLGAAEQIDRLNAVLAEVVKTDDAWLDANPGRWTRREQALIAARAAVNGESSPSTWIKTAEQAPLMNQRVLVAHVSGVQPVIAEWQGQNWRLIASGWNYTPDVCPHWMPLPLPPEPDHAR